MSQKLFTQEEIDLLSKNPYVIKVTPQAISLSLAFKRLVLKETEDGKAPRQIFHDAGLPIEILGKWRIYAIIRRIKKEANSPEGLHEPWGKSKQARMEAFEQKNLAEKQTKVAIKELQDRVIHLEQTIEFLKKIQFPPKV